MNRLCMLALFAVSILSSCMTHSAEVATLGRIERLDPAFDRLVDKAAIIELLVANQHLLRLVGVALEHSLDCHAHGFFGNAGHRHQL